VRGQNLLTLYAGQCPLLPWMNERNLGPWTSHRTAMVLDVTSSGGRESGPSSFQLLSSEGGTQLRRDAQPKPNSQADGGDSGRGPWRARCAPA